MFLSGDKAVGMPLNKQAFAGKGKQGSFFLFNTDAGCKPSCQCAVFTQIAVTKKKQGAIFQPYPVDAGRCSLFKYLYLHDSYPFSLHIKLPLGVRQSSFHRWQKPAAEGIRSVLTLGELEAAASTGLTVLLALNHARVTGKETVAAQGGIVCMIDLAQGP